VCVGRSALTTMNVMASQVNVIADVQTSATCMADVHCSVSFTVMSNADVYLLRRRR